jgi:PelA/Pel-15E family pectate lyase
VILAWLTSVAQCPASRANDGENPTEPLARRAASTLRRAATYFREKVAYRGGYVYYYSLDLQKRWGEGPATPTQIWVQPPGTPTVGLAYLAAYRATGERDYLAAAREAGEALLYGQLRSGGWQNVIDFDPSGRVSQYRRGGGGGKNYSTLDDGITQAAIEFLVRLDEALSFRDAAVHDASRATASSCPTRPAMGFQDAAVHEAATFALEALLKAQFANGAFPQVWEGPVPEVPVVQASFPTYDWRTEGKVKDYWNMYTLNDGLAGTVAQTLITAAEVYQDPRYTQALRKLGDFLLLAQMPPPQPAWAQQYSRQMHPIWARPFEPPAITGGESQDVLRTLVRISAFCGDARYLEPIPAALDYLRASRLPDGRLARYYELQTNRPLYMQRRGGAYVLTYEDRDLPDHYGWKVESALEAIAAEYEAVRKGEGRSPRSELAELARQVEAICDALDDQGRWVQIYRGERLVGQAKFRMGEPYLSSAVFAQHVQTLAAFLEQMK